MTGMRARVLIGDLMEMIAQARAEAYEDAAMVCARLATTEYQDAKTHQYAARVCEDAILARAREVAGKEKP